MLNDVRMSTGSLLRIGFFLLAFFGCIVPIQASDTLVSSEYESIASDGLEAARLQQWDKAIGHFHRVLVIQQQMNADPGFEYWDRLSSNYRSTPMLVDTRSFILSLKHQEFESVGHELSKYAKNLDDVLQILRGERKRWQGRFQISSLQGLPITSIPPAGLFNLALAYDSAGGREVLAITWYIAYLTMEPEPFNATAVSARIVELEIILEKIVRLLNQKAEAITSYVQSVESQISDLLHMPGSSFQDNLASGGVGPEMVVIPAGKYRMGFIHGKGIGIQRNRSHMVHNVKIPKMFAIGKYEVSVQEYAKFAQVSGRVMPVNQGGALHPVAGLHRRDAIAYTKWLSRSTGEKYRLPSEAEWEYAARAGTETKFWWGNTPDHEYANYGAGLAGPVPFPVGAVQGRDQWKFTSPVGSFPANAFGIYDTSGNVWEHTADCYRHNYKKVPSGAGAYMKEGCGAFTMRGGSWGYNGNFIRSAARAKVFWEVKIFLRVGFRVARDIE